MHYFLIIMCVVVTLLTYYIVSCHNLPQENRCRMEFLFPAVIVLSFTFASQVVGFLFLCFKLPELVMDLHNDDDGSVLLYNRQKFPHS